MCYLIFDEKLMPSKKMLMIMLICLYSRWLDKEIIITLS